MNCPSCHAPVADGEPECPACGIVIAKWRNRTAPPHRPAPAAPPPVQTQSSTFSRLVVVLVILIGGGVLAMIGSRLLQPRPAAPAAAGDSQERGPAPPGTTTLRAVDPSGADFDLAFALPGRPQGGASNGRELIIASGSDPWGALRIASAGDRYTSESIPIIESRYDQKTSLNTLTWNGRNYIGYTTGSWFGKPGDVFTIHDPKTLAVLDTHPAPPLLGGLAWDGAHYWASTRKNTPDAAEEAFFYKIDPRFQVVAKSKPPGIGCQGLAWDGQRLWYVDVFSDKIKVLDVSSGAEPRVIQETETPINYLSGVVFHQNAIWVMDYGDNRLQRLRTSTRVALAQYSAPSAIAPSSEIAPAMVIRPMTEETKLSARYKNSFTDRPRDDAEEIEWSVELRDDGVWLTSARLWFGADLFVPREQSSSVITIPVFARYTFTVKHPSGTEVEKEFNGTPGENVLTNVRLADFSTPGEYSVSLFIHVQYVDATGTARILNNSGGWVEVRN